MAKGMTDNDRQGVEAAAYELERCDGSTFNAVGSLLRELLAADVTDESDPNLPAEYPFVEDFH